MQKLSTVFWLFICVKLLCKIPRKKVRKKIVKPQHPLFWFLVWKNKCNSKKKKICEKAYCFDFQYVWKTSVDPRRNKKNRENTAVFVLIFRYDWKTSEKVVKMRKFRLLFVFGVVLQLTPTSGRTTLFLFCILYYSKY